MFLYNVMLLYMSAQSKLNYFVIKFNRVTQIYLFGQYVRAADLCMNKISNICTLPMY